MTTNSTYEKMYVQFSAFLVFFWLLNCTLEFELKSKRSISRISNQSQRLLNTDKYFRDSSFLRIAVYDIPPFQRLVFEPNGTFTWTGELPNILFSMLQRISMRYTLVPLNASQVQKHGTTKAAINQLLSGEVDLAPAVFVPSVERAKIMDFSYPIAMDFYRLLTPKPDEESRLFAFISPLQFTVWLFIFITLVLIILLLSGLAKIGAYWKMPNHHHNKETIAELITRYSVYVCTSLTNQGSCIRIPSISFRLLVASWLLAATVLIYSYSGTLTSHLTLPKMEKSINTFEDLAGRPDVKLLLGLNTVISQKIMSAQTGVYKVLGDRVRQDTSSLMVEASDIFRKLNTLQYAFPTMESACFNIIGSDFEKTGDCRFSVSDPLAFSQYGTIGLRKDGQYNKFISYRVLLLWEAGIIQFELKNSRSKADKCRDIEEKQTSAYQRPIQLVDMAGTFLLLGIGISLSLAIYLIEAFYKKCRPQRNSSVRRRLNLSEHRIVKSSSLLICAYLEPHNVKSEINNS